MKPVYCPRNTLLCSIWRPTAVQYVDQDEPADNGEHGPRLRPLSELTKLIRAHAPPLLQQRSTGRVTAAMSIGRTAGAQRLRSEARFARHAGTAPIRATSGKTIRHRLHRSGGRQLNGAIHIIALGRVACDPESRDHIKRKQSEGKTKLEAIRCLKRHIARQIPC